MVVASFQGEEGTESFDLRVKDDGLTFDSAMVSYIRPCGLLKVLYS